MCSSWSHWSRDGMVRENALLSSAGKGVWQGHAQQAATSLSLGVTTHVLRDAPLAETELFGARLGPLFFGIQRAWQPRSPWESPLLAWRREALTQRGHVPVVLQHHIAVQCTLPGAQPPPLRPGEVHGHVLEGQRHRSSGKRRGSREGGGPRRVADSAWLGEGRRQQAERQDGPPQWTPACAPAGDLRAVSTRGLRSWQPRAQPASVGVLAPGASPGSALPPLGPLELCPRSRHTRRAGPAGGGLREGRGGAARSRKRV